MMLQAWSDVSPLQGSGAGTPQSRQNRGGLKSALAPSVGIAVSRRNVPEGVNYALVYWPTGGLRHGINRRQIKTVRLRTHQP